jgi:hypothetical protein
LGTESVLQRTHFLLSLLKEGIDQLDAMMQFHAYAPCYVFFHV